MQRCWSFLLHRLRNIEDQNRWLWSVIWKAFDWIVVMEFQRILHWKSLGCLFGIDFLYLPPPTFPLYSAITASCASSSSQGSIIAINARSQSEFWNASSPILSSGRKNNQGQNQFVLIAFTLDFNRSENEARREMSLIWTQVKYSSYNKHLLVKIFTNYGLHIMDCISWNA